MSFPFVLESKVMAKHELHVLILANPDAAWLVENLAFRGLVLVDFFVDQFL